MTEHITDDVLATLARSDRDGGSGAEHLAGCTDCRTRMAVWQNIGSAVRAEADERAVTPPSFDALLGPALAGATVPSRGQAAATVPAPKADGRDMSWRTAWQLTLRQAALMPRLWAPLSAAGFVGAALVASARVQDGFGVRLFGAVAVLLVILGALMVASPRRDPRRELLFTLPVPPAAVFLARLTVVLFADVAMAMICSALVDGPGWWPVVTSWLGESLLAASLALALAVRFAPAAGAAAGGALWLLGVVGGPQGLFSTPADALLNALLSTTPWTLLLALALLGWAAGAMRSHGTAASAP
ncbi:hypothetical protein G4Z16_06530 [Streptomyces bathyalis]|uniref:Zinc-finger domain-containing protein n=1 Tax=Streptomyces bathyalis TaxID=2710756 RepID=A0A7T1T4C4_9ACTN|nr:hypothetical protein [Streptomyces bathyalis]QPP06106.1 hypothetical protein G4Z16_06530 [Streptomyces bathyalis]